MSLQLLIQCDNVKDVEKFLDSLSNFVEIFPIDKQYVGLSVPTRVLDDIGESIVHDALSTFSTYDLYSGTWKTGK